jgi:alpha-L-fucosidase
MLLDAVCCNYDFRKKVNFLKRKSPNCVVFVRFILKPIKKNVLRDINKTNVTFVC